MLNITHVAKNLIPIGHGPRGKPDATVLPREHRNKMILNDSVIPTCQCLAQQLSEKLPVEVDANTYREPQLVSAQRM